MDFTELNNIELKGNETYFIKGGIYKDVNIILKSNGTKNSPVFIEGCNKVFLEGKTKIILDGNYLTFKGFKFNGCNGNKIIHVKGDNINFTENSINEMGNNMESYLYVTGYNCRINNNSFSNFDKAGSIVNFKQSKNKELYGLIDNNRFNNRKEIKNKNKNYTVEMVSIGNKKMSSYSSKVSVYNNFFNECYSDNVITVNGNNNLICCNKIFRCYGCISIEGGKDNKIINNYINGEDLEKSGGIKITDEEHSIIGNTIERIISNEPHLSPISILCGKEDNKEEFTPVKNVSILYNDILSCFAGFSIGVNNDGDDNVKPKNLEIKYNRVVKSKYFNLNNDKNIGYEDSQVIDNDFLEKDVRLRIKQGKNIKVSPFIFYTDNFDYDYLQDDYIPLDIGEIRHHQEIEEPPIEIIEEPIQDLLIIDDDDLKTDEKSRDGLLEDIYNSLYVLREFRHQLKEYKKLEENKIDMINNLIKLLD